MCYVEVTWDTLHMARYIRAIKSRRMRWTGHAVHMGEMKILVRQPEGKRPLA
jgi:hypothetical protein